MRRLRARLLLASALGAGALSCAAPGLPPGGPVDKLPPSLERVTPDTNALRVKAKEVVFTFDEIVSERPKGATGASATTLDQLVVISPSESPPVVDWRRDRIAIRPRKGWRPNTGYTVTLLPGLADLSGNFTKKPLQIVFSTGDQIPQSEVRGVVFDWVAQRPVAGARIEATIGKDTLLRWLAAADSLGRFALTHVPPAADMRLRVYSDANGNRLLDKRELWDTLSVALADSARRDFYLFAHDSVAPRLSEPTLVDSTAVRLKFDRGLNPAVPFSLANITVKNKDSTVRAIKGLYRAGEFDSLAAKTRKAYDDSVAKADTSKAARAARAKADSARAKFVNDSIVAAQVAQAKAVRDTARREPAPKPSRPAPPLEFVLAFDKPLRAEDEITIQVTGVVSLDGIAAKPLERRLKGPKPPPKKDSTAVKPGPTKPGAAPDAKAATRDSTSAKTVRDSTAKKPETPAPAPPKKPAADTVKPAKPERSR